MLSQPANNNFEAIFNISWRAISFHTGQCTQSQVEGVVWRWKRASSSTFTTSKLSLPDFFLERRKMIRIIEKKKSWLDFSSREVDNGRNILGWTGLLWKPKITFSLLFLHRLRNRNETLGIRWGKKKCRFFFQKKNMLFYTCTIRAWQKSHLIRLIICNLRWRDYNGKLC